MGGGEQETGFGYTESELESGKGNKKLPVPELAGLPAASGGGTVLALVATGACTGLV